MAELLSSPQEDYGWFSEADLDCLLAAISKHPTPQNLILVGGQSLVAWAVFFGITVPDTGNPALTRDADFLGNKDDARVLAEELGAHVEVATLDDNTPNSAMLTWQSPYSHQLLILDFMKSLVGLDSKKVKETAVPIRYEDGPVIHVLHPLQCLVSRFENLHKLAVKRTGNGIAQARVAVAVCKAFVDELLSFGDAENERKAIKAAHFIAKVARSKAGAFVFSEYGIDALEAVDPSKFVHFPEFATKDWPNHLRWGNNARVTEKKRKAAADRVRNFGKHRAIPENN